MYHYIIQQSWIYRYIIISYCITWWTPDQNSPLWFRELAIVINNLTLPHGWFLSRRSMLPLDQFFFVPIANTSSIKICSTWTKKYLRTIFDCVFLSKLVTIQYYSCKPLICSWGKTKEIKRYILAITFKIADRSGWTSKARKKHHKRVTCECSRMLPLSLNSALRLVIQQLLKPWLFSLLIYHDLPMIYPWFTHDLPWFTDEQWWFSSSFNVDQVVQQDAMVVRSQRRVSAWPPAPWVHCRWIQTARPRRGMLNT